VINLTYLQQIRDQNYSSETSDVDERLKILYCKHCGQYSMVLDVKLSQLPTRKSDGSRVVNEKVRVCRRNMSEGQVKLIKRKKGIERQYRWNCKQCGLFLCYRSVAGKETGKHTFIIADALTDDPSAMMGKPSAPATTSQ
jgi:hypothetical protein